MTKNSISLYIHYPFCVKKCPYCDFNSHVREEQERQSQEDSAKEWARAYRENLAQFHDLLAGKQVHSIFFGGGTPSLMPSWLVASILSDIANHCTISAETEITLEANPTTIEAGSFPGFMAAGINRLSIGVQSFLPHDLQFLGRAHDVEEAKLAIEQALNCCDNVSFDLIYARPNQTLASWQQELELALSYPVKHMSLYQLTIEKGTPFYAMYQRKAFDLPTTDQAADLYQLTEELMKQAGFDAYEVSNYAKPGYESKHNLCYWQYQPYLGIGPGAHSRIPQSDNPQLLQALTMRHQPRTWLNAVFEQDNKAIQQQANLSARECAEEYLLMGLRLRQGISLEKIEAFLQHPWSSLISRTSLTLLIEQGLLVSDTRHIAATPKGRLLLNQVISKLLD